MTEAVVVSGQGFQWVDIIGPTKADLKQIAQKYNLPMSAVQNCLGTDHLPKFERIDKINFITLRAYDEVSPHEADTVQEITRKLAIFQTENSLITIHRKDQRYVQELREKWKSAANGNPIAPILFDLIGSAFSSFESPIDKALTQLEKLEMEVFGAQGAKPFQIQEGYYIKRKAFVYKRMLRSGMDLIPKIAAVPDAPAIAYQDLRQRAETPYFYSDELVESVNSLLSLHISLASQRTNEASHRTNEVVRVLTIFSVFLLPLNVLTGIYGMNFEHIPELKWDLGYPMVLITMAVVTGAIYLWFRKQGWLK